MTSHICNFCNFTFARKDYLNKHLKEKRCNAFSTLSPFDIHEKILSLQKQINKLTVNGDHNNTNIHSNNNINVIININPITQLNTAYIEPDEMKNLLEEYDKKERTPERLNLLISNYLQKMLCNKDHPENHAIKYVKKYPPTFESTIQDNLSVVKNLKDTCELLSDPMITVLKKKLNECVKKYGREFNDIDDFDETIKIIRKELAKPNIKKYLSSFLQNDILNNIEMKLDITPKKGSDDVKNIK